MPSIHQFSLLLPCSLSFSCPTAFVISKYTILINLPVLPNQYNVRMYLRVNVIDVSILFLLNVMLLLALTAVRPAEEVEEEAVARSTRTEKASDGGKVTTTTTVTTHKAKG